MGASWPADVNLLDQIDTWLYKQRWFPGSTGESVRLVANVDLSSYSADPACGESEDALEPVWISIIQVGETFISIPLAYTETKPDFGLITELQGAYLIDGAYSPAFLRAWLRKAHENGTLSPIEPQRGDEALASLLAEASRAFVLTGEQSNTSVRFGGPFACVLKLLRVLHPGLHPEVEVTLELAKLGWPHVPKPIAYLEEEFQLEGLRGNVVLGFAGSLVNNGRDGFELFVEIAGKNEDPAPLARDLGTVTAGLHEHMAKAFGESAPAQAEQLKDRLRVNLAAAAAEVPRLRESDLIEPLEAKIEGIGNIENLPPMIRIHGDYHLGQTLLGEDGWVILDFEGEPLRPLEERREPDFALRDVAGMLRSFDYAAAKGGANQAWLHAAREAFIDGYTGGGGLGKTESELSAVLEIEKAAYEAVYEYRMRPDWIWIPENALTRLAK